MFEKIKQWVLEVAHNMRFSNFFGNDETPAEETHPQTATQPQKTIEQQPQSSTPNEINDPKPIYLKEKPRLVNELRQQLHNKKIVNLSVEEIPSPGVIIKTGIYDRQQHCLQIYGYQFGSRIRLTDDGQIMNLIEERHPDLELDEPSLNAYRVFINHEVPANFYTDTNVKNFAKDVTTFVNVLTQLAEA